MTLECRGATIHLSLLTVSISLCTIQLQLLQVQEAVSVYNKVPALISSNTTHVYFHSECTLICRLNISACTWAIIRHFNT